MTDTSAQPIPPKQVLMRSLVDIGMPSTRDKILARATVGFPDYDIPVAVADQELKSAVNEGLLRKQGTENPTYIITSAGLTDLGPQIQEVEQDWEEGRTAGPIS